MAPRVGVELTCKPLNGMVFFRDFGKLPLNLPLKSCAAVRLRDTPWFAAFVASGLFGILLLVGTWISQLGKQAMNIRPAPLLWT